MTASHPVLTTSLLQGVSIVQELSGSQRSTGFSVASRAHTHGRKSWLLLPPPPPQMTDKHLGTKQRCISLNHKSNDQLPMLLPLHNSCLAPIPPSSLSGIETANILYTISQSFEFYGEQGASPYNTAMVELIWEGNMLLGSEKNSKLASFTQALLFPRLKLIKAAYRVTTTFVPSLINQNLPRSNLLTRIISMLKKTVRVRITTERSTTSFHSQMATASTIRTSDGLLWLGLVTDQREIEGNSRVASISGLIHKPQSFMGHKKWFITKISKVKSKPFRIRRREKLYE